MNPNKTEEWLDIARERAADAEAMMPARRDSIGPVYMAGYAIECSLKAYLQKCGKPQMRGAEGHNLSGL